MDRPLGPDIDGLIDLLEHGGLRAPAATDEAPLATADPARTT